MKTLAILISLLFSASAIFSQVVKNIIKPTGTVQYKFINKWEKKEHNATLQFNDHASLYFYGRTKDGLEQREVKEVGNNTTLEIADAEGWSNYQNFEKKQFISRDLIWTKFVLIEEETPDFAWNITDTQKKIGNFNCQEAICTFRGRTYHAWFTMDIPMSIGPWKLSGLPGLILEAYDENKEYQFVFVAIKIPTDDVTLIIPPTLSKKKMNWIDFNDGRKRKLEEVTKMLSSDMNQDGSSTIKLEVHNLEVFE